MKGNLSLDHIVILVDDLSAATQDYTALGFTVVKGGEHENGQTHNALIAFADGSYLELIAFKEPSSPSSPSEDEPNPEAQGSPFERRLSLRRAAGEGLVDFALLPDTIEEAIDGALGLGLTLYGPIPGGRLRPDGQQVSWQVGIPDSIALPFFCADLTPRSLRVPASGAHGHANGATGVLGITVAVSDLGAISAQYSSLLGITPSPTTSSGARNIDFVLNSVTITLVEPGEKKDSLNNHLQKRGEGPFALKLATNDKINRGSLDPVRAHGARIELVFE